MQLINHADVRNSYQSISTLKDGLTQEINAPTYAIYDQGFTTNGCSISLSLVLDDEDKSDSDGYPVGMCETSVCPSGTNQITDDWVLVSPEEVHRMTVDWWKTEPKLQE